MAQELVAVIPVPDHSVASLYPVDLMVPQDLLTAEVPVVLEPVAVSAADPVVFILTALPRNPTAHTAHTENHMADTEDFPLPTLTVSNLSNLLLTAPATEDNPTVSHPTADHPTAPDTEDPPSADHSAVIIELGINSETSKRSPSMLCETHVQ